jgi:IS1 family transposase
MHSLVRLWVFTLVPAAAREQKLYGSPYKRVYRQCAVCYTDFWEAYEQVLPTKRHRAVGKETGKTNHIEKDTGGELLRHREMSVDSTILCANGSGAWYAGRYLSLKN